MNGFLSKNKLYLIFTSYKDILILEYSKDIKMQGGFSYEGSNSHTYDSRSG